uniref:Uncharacterized protein n=1 Tax=Sus scrofa TaxID=9823 RepID=A0A8D1EJR2_PIG
MEVPRDPMASWCTRCGQQDPGSLPYTSVRITEAEMRAYHHFLGSCIRLEYMAKKGTVRVMIKMKIRIQTRFLKKNVKSEEKC